MARSTIHTTLKYGTEQGSLTKMCPITSYPDLIGTPENIEVTDLDCEQQTFVPGVKSLDTMEFEANYDKTVYSTLSANEKKDGYFELEFGTGGLRGVIGAGTNRINKYTVRRATFGLANYILEKCGE